MEGCLAIEQLTTRCTSELIALTPRESNSDAAMLHARLQVALPPLFPAGLIEQTRTSDVAKLWRPAGWALDFEQLGYGEFRGCTYSAFTANLGLTIAACTPGIIVRGTVPADCALLAIPLSASGATHRGVDLAAEAMVVLLAGEELDLRVLESVELVIVVCAGTLLESHAEALLGCSIASARRDSQLTVDSGVQRRHRLRGFVAGVAQALRHDPAQLSRPFAAAMFDSAAVCAMLEESAGVPTRHPGPTRRRALALAAESHMRKNLRASLNIAGLCKAVGAPERTLHLAFKEHFGLSPKAHLKMLRLNAVRRELRSSGGCASITETAMNWGFWHLGWFAHDYREMFGERPTQTVQAATVAAFG